MSEPDAGFRAAVAILGGRSTPAARRYDTYRLVLAGEAATVTREDMAKIVQWYGTDPAKPSGADHLLSMLHLLTEYRMTRGGRVTVEQVRALVFGVHAGMAAQELWDCVHGASWPPEGTLLTLGALRDPRVAAALATIDAGTNRPSTEGTHV